MPTGPRPETAVGGLEREEAESNNADEEGYVLARGYAPSARLNLQFYVWQEAVGFDLHPSALANHDTTTTDFPNGSQLKIADVATGTGIWLCVLSKQLPSSAQLDGFDVSSSQFPHPSSLPTNVRLRICDAKSDPPEELCGVYDVVHVRLLLAAIEDNDPGPVLRHCRKLLKPGGILQWDEIDPKGLELVPMEDPFPTPYLDEMRNILVSNMPRDSWISNLPQLFAQNGFSSASTEREIFYERPWQRNMMMEVLCLVLEDHARYIEQTGPSGKEKANDLRRKIPAAYEEVRRGAFYKHRLQVVIGRAE